jgi:hypothetical protein
VKPTTTVVWFGQKALPVMMDFASTKALVVFALTTVIL